MGLFSSSSKSSQNEEGDLIFNNSKSSNTVNTADGSVGSGYQSGGGSPLENFNVGRGNKLYGNTFTTNVTDGAATANALKSNEAVVKSSNAVVEKGAAYAIGSNEATAARAINAGTNAALINAEVADKAIEQANKASSEAIKAANESAKQFSSKISSFANRSNAEMGRLARDTTSSVFGFAGDSLGTYAALVDQTGQQIAGTLDYAENATGKALDYVFASTQSESERVAGDVIKMAGWAIAGIAAMFVLTKWGA